MERRFVGAAQCRVRIENRADDKRAIVGYGAVYYDGTPATEFKLWSGTVERIMPGAFDRAVKEDDVRALFNHDPNHLLGRSTAGTLKLSTDETGLRYDIDPPDTQIGRDVMVSLDRKDITGSSFSFSVISETWRDDEAAGIVIRELNEVRLFDVSPVTYPAYEGANAGVRVEGNLDEARASYKAFHDEIPHDYAPDPALRLRLAETEL